MVNNINHSNDSYMKNTFFDRASQMISKTLNTNKIFKNSKSWGKSVEKDKFQDIDLLESGFAREYITEECLSPTTTKGDTWTNCYVKRINKHQFKLYEDGTDRFLLSAKQINTTFYISQYEDFPELEGEPSNYFCAVLKKHPTLPNFKLFNCGCEGCDKGYMKYSCISNNIDIKNNSVGCAFDSFDLQTECVDRQLLADITHSIKRVKYVDADMRDLSIVLPAIMDDNRSRVVWCPRLNGDSTPSGTCPNSASKFVTSPTASNRKLSFVESREDRINIVSKLPEWNHDLNSLVLKFHGGRVLAASSKNVLLNEKNNSSTDLLQFGKSKKGKFILDFRYPIAPIQAFGISLSMCCWTIE